ncbi:MAG TPA: iron-sulfur cluster assembly protein [Candidatus Omnitrophota bacterium]|nr:iron-sulfur cluster assembly protein [Candidatus Omnitrophota bacterium]
MMADIPPQDPIEKQVWDQLRLCYDYEIPVNIVELGLIYGVTFTDLPEGKQATIQMTFTSPMCPMGDVIKKDIERRVSAIPHVRKVLIEIVWDPPWDQTRMSEAAKLQLGLM